MESSVGSTSGVSCSSERFTGRVKWFNNKAGYGFITITDGDKSGIDVFVHHSEIKVDFEQYKYLVQGEYVDFSLSDTKTQEHEFQAGEVCGIKGGKLMCETRRDSRVSRSQYRSSSNVENSELEKMPKSVSPPKTQRTSRVRGQGPRDDGNDWNYVSKAKIENVLHSKPSRGRGRPTTRSEGTSQSL
jgi:CspA family cold shock protein